MGKHRSRRNKRAQNDKSSVVATPDVNAGTLVQDEALGEEQMEQGGGEDAVGQEEGDEGEGSDERDGEESSENKEDGEQEGGEDEDGAEVAGEEDGEQEESDDEESDDEYPAMTSMNDLTMDLTSLLLACNRGSLAELFKEMVDDRIFTYKHLNIMLMIYEKKKGMDEIERRSVMARREQVWQYMNDEEHGVLEGLLKFLLRKVHTRWSGENKYRTPMTWLRDLLDGYFKPLERELEERAIEAAAQEEATQEVVPIRIPEVAQRPRVAVHRDVQGNAAAGVGSKRASGSKRKAGAEGGQTEETQKRTGSDWTKAIPTTCGDTAAKKLHMSGRLRKSSTEPQAMNRCRLVPYRTDYYVSIPFFFQWAAHTCSQAALVMATGIDLPGLGIQWLDPKRTTKEMMKFGEMNQMLQSSSGLGRLFVLTKLRPELRSDREVFCLDAGVYIIHTYWYSMEDVHFFDDEVELRDGTESFPHYVVYNAGTRVLYLNPDVIVLEESDKKHPDFFCKKLLKEYGFYISHRGHVRKLMMKVCEDAMNTRYNTLNDLK